MVDLEYQVKTTVDKRTLASFAELKQAFKTIREIREKRKQHNLHQKRLGIYSKSLGKIIYVI